MKIAYLVLAHNNPEHLAWLLGQLLLQPEAGCFVHIDRKSDIEHFRPALQQDGRRIRPLDDRHAVFWGDFSTVTAILALMKAGLGDPACFDRFVLLSGVDSPLRSPKAVHAFFSAHPETEFINLVEIPNPAAGKPLSRISRFQPRANGPRLWTWLHKAFLKAGFAMPHRNYKAALGGLVPHGGSTWWALTRGAAEEVIRFADSEKRTVRFFENTVLADESFFHTILANSTFKPRVARNLTYADWSAGLRNPETLGPRHVAFFRTRTQFPDNDTYGGGEMLFARKWKDGQADLLEELNRDIAARELTSLL